MASDKGSEPKKNFTVNDRRFWLNDDEDLKGFPDQVDIKPPHYVEELESKLQEKEKTLIDYIQAHKSSVADLDEVRIRIEKDLDRRVEIEKARLSEAFLDVLDNLMRLHQACSDPSGAESTDLIEGLALVIKQIEEKLTKIGLEPIFTKGERFDPNTMEAMMTAEVDKELDGVVVDEMRPGYVLGERVVRPAGVRVGVVK